MPHDLTGWIHTITALMALITGSLILAQTKGTSLHKITGRIYGISMLSVCATAFMIYRVHETFGVLHLFSLVSTVTLLLGMLPLYMKGYKNPIITHLSWMYWSVIGLYCAFGAEIFTRVPLILHLENSYAIFYTLIGISTGFIGFVGSHFFKTRKVIWVKHYGGNKLQ